MSERDGIDAGSVVTDARSIAGKWSEGADLSQLSADLLESSKLDGLTIDTVAIGKSSLEMTEAIVGALGAGVRRRLTVVDGSIESYTEPKSSVFVGEHPVPGEGSLRAGRAVLDFLDQPSEADATLFLISGGASSLCVAPAPPLTLGDVVSVWEAALRSGADITTLNMVRAAGSLIAGGAVLGHVGTAQSRSFILVDNVVSGAKWVASAMTYDFRPSEALMFDLWDRIGVTNPGVRSRLLEGSRTRAALMEGARTAPHENAVLADPSMMHERAVREALHRGYRVLDMGAAITGDVNDVITEWSSAIATAPPGAVALVGAGEVTVKVHGPGKGGRCQEFAWLMADVLAKDARVSAFVAQASDGRDYVEGVAGAWVDNRTSAAIRDQGIDWAAVAQRHDTHAALKKLDKLIDGGHTGWNLCDLYVAVLS